MHRFCADCIEKWLRVARYHAVPQLCVVCCVHASCQQKAATVELVSVIYSGPWPWYGGALSQTCSTEHCVNIGVRMCLQRAVVSAVPGTDAEPARLQARLAL